MDFPERAAAIEELYAAFARYPRAERVEGCPHCVGTDESLPFCTAPLRSVSAEMIARYAFKAMTTWGTLDDYKHFLPRILELSSTREAQPWPGLEWWLVASKIRYGGWSTWPDDERRAVFGFLRGTWSVILDTPPERTDLPGFLGSVAELDAIGPYLDHWAQNAQPTSLRHLADSVVRYSDKIARSLLPWEAHGRDPSAELRQNAREFSDWLLHPSRREALLTAFERWSDEPWAAALAEAHDILDCILP